MEPTTMFIDVEPNDNINSRVSTLYRDRGTPREVYCIKYDLQGTDEPVQITGYDLDTGKPCPAYACPIEESGDGLALLIYGGSGGIRLKRLEDESAWDVSSTNQWGETHLIYPHDSFIVYKDQI